VDNRRSSAIVLVTRGDSKKNVVGSRRPLTARLAAEVPEPAGWSCARPWRRGRRPPIVTRRRRAGKTAADRRASVPLTGSVISPTHPTARAPVGAVAKQVTASRGLAAVGRAALSCRRATTTVPLPAASHRELSHPVASKTAAALNSRRAAVSHNLSGRPPGPPAVALDASDRPSYCKRISLPVAR
jgi:hypothetical protein